MRESGLVLTQPLCAVELIQQVWFGGYPQAAEVTPDPSVSLETPTSTRRYFQPTDRMLVRLISDVEAAINYDGNSTSSSARNLENLSQGGRPEGLDSPRQIRDRLDCRGLAAGQGLPPLQKHK